MAVMITMIILLRIMRFINVKKVSIYKDLLLKKTAAILYEII